MSSRRLPDKRLRASLSFPASPGLPSCAGRDNRRSTSYNRDGFFHNWNRIGAGGSFTMATTHASKPRRQPKTILAPPAAPLAGVTTIGDLLKRLGNIPAGRVRLHPTPGTATEKDVIEILDRENRPCELVEGTLVEKPVGYEESEIAVVILTALYSFVRPRKLGIVTGPDGT